MALIQSRGPIQSKRGPIQSKRGPIQLQRGLMQLQRDQIGSWRGPISCWRGQCYEWYPQICYFIYVFISLLFSWSQLFQYLIIDWLIPSLLVQIQVKSPSLSHRNRPLTDQPLKHHKSLQETLFYATQMKQVKKTMKEPHSICSSQIQPHRRKNLKTDMNSSFTGALNPT